jgi:hypothetical protein
MNSRAKSLIVLAAILVICVGAYIGVSVYNKNAADKKAAETASTQIYPAGLGTPTAITYTTGGKTLSFVSDGDTWYWTADNTFPLNQAKLSSIASALEGLSAVRSFDAAGPLSDYGLEQPSSTITATAADGNTFTLNIGSQAGANYYATADRNRIYTIDPTLAGYLEPNILGLIVLDPLPSFSQATVEKITLAGGGKTLTLDKHKENDGTYSWFIVEGKTYTLSDEYKIKTPSERTARDYVNGAVSALSSLSFSACAAYKPADTSPFGLNAPGLTLTIDYKATTVSGEASDETAVLEIGAAAADGSGYYARLAGSQEINLLPGDAVTPMTDALNMLGITG